MLFAQIPTWAPFALGVVLVTVVLLRRSRGYYRRRLQRRPSTSLQNKTASNPGPDRPLADAPCEILRWQVEMHETARDLKAELDSKFAALGVVLRQAQCETARLESAICRARQLGITGEFQPLEQIESLSPLSNDPVFPSTIVPHQSRIYAMADQGHSAATIARELGRPVGDVEMALALRSVR